MTIWTDRGYYALLTSLPALPRLDRADTLPISQIRLQARLSDLDETDQADLRTVEALLHWERLALATPDAHLVAAARRALPRLAERGVDDLVRERLELRTAIAALRRRAAGGPAPERGEVWGFGRYLLQIRQHWDRPTLGLEHVLPVIAPCQRLLESGDAAGLERTLLQNVWDRLARAGEGHYFDFRALVIYVLRWNILDRWISHDGAAAVERFSLLCDEALAGVALEWEAPA